MDYTALDHQSFIMAQIIGSLFMGALIGAFPLTIGFIKGQKKLAVAGVFACLIGSFVAGFFLSIPLCILFVVLIFGADKKSRGE